MLDLDGPVWRIWAIRVLSRAVSGGNWDDHVQLPVGVLPGLFLSKSSILDGATTTAHLLAVTIDSTRSHRSTDPRDKVFGLLGIVGKAARMRNLEECPIKADYGKTVVQVYEKATLYILKNTSHLESLGMICDPSRSPNTGFAILGYRFHCET